jgi:hypothetical protein
MNRYNTLAGVCIAAVISVAAATAQNPITSIITPEAGDTFYVGDTMRIAWTADEALLGAGIIVEISFDGGDTPPYQISPGESMMNSARDMEYVIEDSLRVWDYDSDEFVNISTLSDNALIYVSEYDGDGLVVGPLHILPKGGQAVLPRAAARTRGALRVTRSGSSGFVITVPDNGAHTLRIVDGHGRVVQGFTAPSPATHVVGRESSAPGVYFVQVRTAKTMTSTRVSLIP